LKAQADLSLVRHGQRAILKLSWRMHFFRTPAGFSPSASLISPAGPTGFPYGAHASSPKRIGRGLIVNFMPLLQLVMAKANSVQP
jgi:hypothetical protein